MKRELKHWLKFGCTILLLALCDRGLAWSADQITLTATKSRERLDFAASYNFDPVACTAALVAGLTQTAVQARGISLLTLPMTSASYSVSALSVQPIATLAAPTRVFFAIRADCPQGEIRSNVEAVTPAVSRRSPYVTRNQWIAHLKDRFSLNRNALSDRFPALTFTGAVDIKSPADSSNRIFVVEKAGKVKVFLNDPAVASAETGLDLTSQVLSSGIERGLLGLAFHPNFAANGYIYLYYTRNPDGASILSRFTLNPSSSNTVDSTSELVLLAVSQPKLEHKGGALVFGSDGYLYVSLGDGGGQGDPARNGQKKNGYLAKILRLDVDHSENGMNYAIPSDNPFANASSGFIPETFAYGFRNPWRMSFDTESGRLIAGDVGQFKHEEIDLVQAGKNYGWSIMEGDACYRPVHDCKRRGLQPPLRDYERDLGSAIIGGYVYRGALLPALVGQYIYGDFSSGYVFALNLNNIRQPTNSILVASALFPAAFGVDPAGEILVASYQTGKLYRLE
ncbi:MAG: PQQ-dependent sugar dehydrogenase [Oligoflexia bacterium]|nr:PQQ-dependent sugar dehydrogenase [Oligoflexia bacterium]